MTRYSSGVNGKKKKENRFIGNEADKAKAVGEFKTGVKSGGLGIGTKPGKGAKADKAAGEQPVDATAVLAGAQKALDAITPGALDYNPAAVTDPVRSGASRGASYIGSFDEYNTEDAAGKKR